MKRLDLTGTTRQKEEVEVSRDQRIRDLLALSPSQSDTFVENKLAEGKYALLFKIIFRMLIIIGRKLIKET